MVIWSDIQLRCAHIFTTQIGVGEGAVSTALLRSKDVVRSNRRRRTRIERGSAR